MGVCQFGGRFGLVTEVTGTKAQNPPFGGFRTWRSSGFAFLLEQIYLPLHQN